MGTHYAFNCVAFAHKVNGFTQNSPRMATSSSTACPSPTDQWFKLLHGRQSRIPGKQNVFKNNVGIRRNPASSGNNFIADNTPLEQNNSWNLAVTPNAADYVSLLKLPPKHRANPTAVCRLVLRACSLAAILLIKG